MKSHKNIDYFLSKRWSVPSQELFSLLWAKTDVKFEVFWEFVFEFARFFWLKLKYSHASNTPQLKVQPLLKRQFAVVYKPKQKQRFCFEILVAKRATQRMTQRPPQILTKNNIFLPLITGYCCLSSYHPLSVIYGQKVINAKLLSANGLQRWRVSLEIRK